MIGSGTAGTFTGVARYMKENDCRVCMLSRSKRKDRCWAADKPGKHKVEGIGASFIPKNFDPSVCDEVMMVTDDDAFDMVKAAGGERRRAGRLERRGERVCGVADCASGWEQGSAS